MPFSAAYLAAWVLALSAAAFFLFLRDKALARRHAWRIPERTLWLVCLLGGAPGGWLGMRLCRHKTRHAAFRYGLPVLAVVQIGLVVWGWSGGWVTPTF